MAKTKSISPQSPEHHDTANIAICAIIPSKTNPRKSFDYKSIADLAESMREVGLIQPIILRPDADGFEIVAGERRYRAAQQLGWEAIPAIVRKVTDDQVLEIQIIENLQREDVDPIDEAAAFKTLLKKESLEWLASRIHKSKKYITDRLKLNDLTQEGREHVHNGILPITHAIMIAKLPEAEQGKALKECVGIHYGSETVVCKQTVTELKSFIENRLMIDFGDACFDPTIDNLVPGVVACTNCFKRTCNQNLLFSDITEDDRCTDAACFHAKEKAHVELSLQVAKSKMDKGRVFSGETTWAGHAVKVGGVEMKYSEKKTRGKEMAAIVITKVAGIMEKKNLGKTVYVDVTELETKKEEKEKRKEEGVSSRSNAETWMDRRITKFNEITIPRINKLNDIINFKTIPNIDAIVDSVLKRNLYLLDDKEVLLIARLLGIYKTKLPEEELINIDDEVHDQESGESIMNEVYESIIKQLGASKTSVLIAALQAIDDDDNEDENSRLIWKELINLIEG